MSEPNVGDERYRLLDPHGTLVEVTDSLAQVGRFTLNMIEDGLTFDVKTEVYREWTVIGMTPHGPGHSAIVGAVEGDTGVYGDDPLGYSVWAECVTAWTVEEAYEAAREQRSHMSPTTTF